MNDPPKAKKVGKPIEYISTTWNRMKLWYLGNTETSQLAGRNKVLHRRVLGTNHTCISFIHTEVFVHLTSIEL